MGLGGVSEMQDRTQGAYGMGQGQARQNWGAGPTHLQVTSPLCLLTTQAPSRQRLHLFTWHLGPSK